jgi:outer membrane protein TolC
MKRRLARSVLGWLTGSVAAILALGGLAGCHQTFLAEEVYKQAYEGLPKNFEVNHDRIMDPLTAPTAAPPTVISADRAPRYLQLQEAIAIALENGHVSGRAGGGFGRPDDNLITFNGPSSLNAQSERIRVLALNPGITHAAIEASMARFDPVWITSINWVGTDAISGVPNLPGYLGTVPGQTATFQSSIVKAFATGGTAELSFLTDYRQLTNQANNPFAFGPLNPQYSARVSVGLEQPLWKDWGVEMNQLLSRFPNILGLGLVGNSAFLGFNQHQNAVSSFIDRQTEGILISRLRFDQQRTEFERSVQTLLVNTEVAYWNLYNKYGQLYSFEENFRIMHRAWQDNYNKFKAGQLAPEKYHQASGQYHEFRGERLRALDEVIAAERDLRAILGMKNQDGTRLIPITPPTLAELKPDWESSVRDALNLRPEILLARDNVKYHQYLLSIQKNNLKPDLRVFARFEPFGDGSTLTGSGTFTDASGTVQPTNAFRSLTHTHLADYQIGINLNMPLGFRAEFAAIRAARLELTQSYFVLKDQEEKAIRYLEFQVAEVAHWWERIKVHRAERIGYRDSLMTLYDLTKNGKKTFGDPEFLEAQRRYAAALVKEYQAIAEYNNSLARLEWAKGTNMRYNNVHISEGALPECAQIRAVDYQKERTHSIMLKTRPDNLNQPGVLIGEKVTEPISLRTELEEDKSILRYRVAPSEREQLKAPPPVIPASTEGIPLPPISEVKPIEYRPEGTPKVAPPRTPEPLPKLDPSLLVVPPNTGSLPPSPLQAPLASTRAPAFEGVAGFVTIGEPIAVRASLELLPSVR